MLMENFLCKQKNQIMAWIDNKKAFDTEQMDLESLTFSRIFLQ